MFIIVVVPLLLIASPLALGRLVEIEPVPVMVSVPEVSAHCVVTAVLIVPPLEVHSAIDEV